MGRNYKKTPGVVHPYQKDWQRLPTEFFVLTINEMAESDKKFALAELANIYDGVSAQRYALANAEHGWRCETLDQLGRIFVLRYKGVEVAQFYRRQVSKHRVEEGVPLSSARMKDPNDVWMRFELTGLSARQLKKPTLNKMSSMAAEQLSLQRKVAILEAVIDKQDEQIKGLKQELKEAKEKKREKPHELRKVPGDNNAKVKTKSPKKGKGKADRRRANRKDSRKRKR